MTAYQRQILITVYDLERERRGPVPMWLIAVAVNAGGEVARDKVNAELLDLRQAGMLRYASTPDLGKGLCVTDTGREALAQLPPEPTQSGQTARKPLPPKVPEVDESPTAQPVATTKRQATIAEAASKARPRDDVVTHDRSPALYDLLADLGGLVAERLHELRGGDDIETLGRWRDAGLRIQRHTGGPQS